jgi:hypothetical protein
MIHIKNSDKNIKKNINLKEKFKKPRQVEAMNLINLHFLLTHLNQGEAIWNLAETAEKRSCKQSTASTTEQCC